MRCDIVRDIQRINKSCTNALKRQSAIMLDAGILAARFHKRGQRILLVNRHQLEEKNVTEKDFKKDTNGERAVRFVGIAQSNVTSFLKSSLAACRLTASNTPSSLPTLGIRGTCPGCYDLLMPEGGATYHPACAQCDAPVADGDSVACVTRDGK